MSALACPNLESDHSRRPLPRSVSETAWVQPRNKLTSGTPVAWDSHASPVGIPFQPWAPASPLQAGVGQCRGTGKGETGLPSPLGCPEAGHSLEQSEAWPPQAAGEAECLSLEDPALPWTIFEGRAAEDDDWRLSVSQPLASPMPRASSGNPTSPSLRTPSRSLRYSVSLVPFPTGSTLPTRSHSPLPVLPGRKPPPLPTPGYSPRDVSPRSSTALGWARGGGGQRRVEEGMRRCPLAVAGEAEAASQGCQDVSMGIVPGSAATAPATQALAGFHVRPRLQRSESTLSRSSAKRYPSEYFSGVVGQASASLDFDKEKRLALAWEAQGRILDKANSVPEREGKWKGVGRKWGQIRGLSVSSVQMQSLPLAQRGHCRHNSFHGRTRSRSGSTFWSSSEDSRLSTQKVWDNSEPCRGHSSDGRRALFCPSSRDFLQSVSMSGW